MPAFYKEKVSKYYADLVDPTDPNCPIRRQAYFDPVELEPAPSDFSSDPLGDLEHKPAPHITHRYQNRVLLHVTSECAMYCRYCFRKSLLNEKVGDFMDGSLQKGLSYISDTKDIKEVIFSGGDPFTISPRLLASIWAHLRQAEHLEVLRFHTRVPVTDPQLLKDDFYLVLENIDLPKIVVTHFNHPRELTSEARLCVDRLKSVGCQVLNQSVLLKGVNDKSDVLAELSWGLFLKLGILPYYLHHPDRAKGTSHFYLSVKEGKVIYEKIRSQLPGYLLPRYVMDLGDTHYKKPVHELTSH